MKKMCAAVLRWLKRRGPPVYGMLVLRDTGIGHRVA